MSDANNDKPKTATEWRKEKHPNHFGRLVYDPTESWKKCYETNQEVKSDIGAKEDFLAPPTREWYLELHKSLCNRMIEITARKNADYTGGSADNDAFANFRQVERLGICSTEAGFLTRMTDKMSRINSFVKKGELKVKDESVEDTLLDLANYCLLMYGYIRSKK